MAVNYSFISKIYGLIDLVYFRNKNDNPRYILMNKFQNNNANLLDIAIGTAENSILIAKQNPKINIFGIDLSDEMLEIAKSKIEKHDVKNIKLIKMNGSNMSFNNEMFEYIIISLLFHELPEDISNKILNECKRVLKKDGKIYVLEWEKPKCFLKKVLFYITELSEPKEYKIFMGKDLNNYFLKNGFKINSIEYGNYSKVMELVKSEPAIRSLSLKIV
jgi:demethylmenaquinone methyltransferase/2-methoxy-6-polyprenyl-1,4-benzoquinol methylase